MSKEQLLKKAHSKHMQGKLQAAAKLYQEILRIRPNDLDATYLLGTLYAESGDLPRAKEFLERADSINPSSPYIKVNLGNICKSQGDFAKASELYQQALSLDDSLPQAYIGLGNILETVENDWDGALLMYRNALQLAPNDPLILQATGNFLVRHGDSHALEYLQLAARLNPRLPAITKDCGIACVRFGRPAEGARYLRQSLNLFGEDPEARYYLTIAEGTNPDRQLQQEYARLEFDRFAPEFEQTLVNGLGYTIPGQIVQLIKDTQPEGFRFRNGADLGCGTGLFGLEARGHADTLVGIDISPHMIELASGRGCYDELLCGDVTTVLQGIDAKFDLFSATDVLVYIGDLDELFSVMTARAENSALFVCSTESVEGDGFVLRPSGRYAHSRQYMKLVADKHSWQLIDCKQVPLRKEYGSWIDGELYIFRYDGNPT